ncbi:queuosine precursor transporter [Candidatus Nomurabacteria bacterium]|nr:queuosine precursor transporter [Candidatus Nomurabacteria bacterium]
MKSKNLRYFDVVMVYFATMLLISNLAATKLIAFGPIVTDGGAILFPLIYILNDVLTEVYGYKYARRAIWTGFGVMILAIFAFTVVRYMPVASEYTDQSSYEAILGFFPRIVAASLIAYLVGSFINSYVLVKMKIKYQGKKLWARLIGSTFVAEFFDTLVFALVAFGGVLGMTDMAIFILVGWLFKTGVEVVMLPVSYRIINALKRVEKIDANDKNTDLSPLRFEI